jgi:type II secretory pathway pseudopilin PulG
MRFRPTSSTRSGVDGRSGFTLAESLAALAFLAVVIPVAVQGVRIANLAGQVAERKVVAAQVADRVLSELVVTGRWNTSSQGTVDEGRHQFSWRSESTSWERATLRQATVVVTYKVQGKEYEVRAATILDSAQVLQ